MRSQRLSLLGLALLLLSPACLSQECHSSLTAADQFLVRSVAFRIRYFHPPDIPIRSKATYNPADLLPSLEAIRQELDAHDSSNALLEVARFGYISSRFLTSCVRVVPPDRCQADVGAARCVDVTFSDYEIRVVNAGGALLPIPRSPFRTDLSGVPRPLLILNPSFNLAHDNRTGFTPQFRMKTNLLDITSLAENKPVQDHPLLANFAAEGSFSLNHSFFHADEVLEIARERSAKTLRKLALRIEQGNSQQPLGPGSDSYSQETGGARLDLHLDQPYISDIRFLASATGSRHSVPQTTGSLKTSEVSGSASLLLDGRIADSTTRFGLWYAGGFPNNAGSYQRLQFFSGAFKDVLVATNQSFGVQVLAGAGHIWGAAPQYARFFAGNNNANFLYQSTDTLLTQPPLPVVRSFGTREAGVNIPSTISGATTFWNVSATVSIPVPFWSRPLIPDETVLDPNVTLKHVLKTSGTTSARNLLAATLKAQGLSSQEAAKQAAKIIDRDIAPAITYIADHANIFSVKPIVLFDLAQQSASGLTGRHVESFGSGLEFMLVTVALEAGYARTLNRLPGDRAGNVFVNLQFRNFF